jgi:hypothetical protein
MLWKETTAGFVIAGFVAVLQGSVFQTAFFTDAPNTVQTVENVVIGPLIAVLSFVCSVGNIPLASVLRAGGMSFAGVIALIYADLITLPILLIYRKYYGTRFALKLAGLMFACIIRGRACGRRALLCARRHPGDAPVDRVDHRPRHQLQPHGRAQHPVHPRGNGARLPHDLAGREGPRLPHARRPLRNPVQLGVQGADLLLLLERLQGGVRDKAGALREARPRHARGVPAGCCGPGPDLWAKSAVCERLAVPSCSAPSSSSPASAFCPTDWGCGGRIAIQWPPAPEPASQDRGNQDRRETGWGSVEPDLWEAAEGV